MNKLNIFKKMARTVSKHQASKKGHKHVHNLSKGEMNHKMFEGGK